VLRITWRLQRTGLIGMTAFGAAYGLFQTAAYYSAAGSTAAQRAAFGHEMEVLGRSLSYLLPIPVRVDTVPGYLQWRVYGALPILFVFWALMSASGATRGDEEHGLVEQWLSAGVGKARYMALRFLAFLVASVVAVAATSTAIALVAATGGSPLDAASVFEMSAAVLAVTVVCYGIAFVAAQLTGSRNAAAGLAGVLLLALFFMNGFSRTVDGLKPLASIVSPFYYYDRSNPLTPGGTFDALRTAGLLAAGFALAALAAWLMRIRDLGAPLLRRRSHRGATSHHSSPNRLLRIPVVSALFEQRLGLLTWGLGTAAGATFIASIGRQMVDLVNGPGGFRAYLTLVGHGDPYVAITGFFWFGIFQMLLAVYAITQVARWSSDDNEGRLEMVLSAPVSRSRVVGERALVLLVATVAIIAVSSVAFYISAHSENIELHASDLAAASTVLVPFVLSFAAIGALLASRVPRQTVAVLATIAFLSYLITEGGPLMKWPDWVLKLSVFSLYGSPLTSGVYWTGLWILLVVTVVGFGLAAVLMQRRDVGS
jgi:ABC-2 type transport system permease protein